MFGDLFEEDEEGFSSVPSGGRFVKGKEAEPPPPRGNVSLSGIKNQGGTCYLNSLIQTLLFTPEFREELFSLGPDELGNLTDKDNPDAKVRVIPLELQRLFAHLLLMNQQAASTSDLTESFGWTNNEETSQHDVQELNRILFSALESSLVGTSGSNLIHRLYHGTLVNQIVCKECSNVSERQEDFLDLTVSVRGLSSLEEALWSMFVEEELFEGNNLYRCSRCNQLVQAAKSAKLRKLPPFLTMSLLRFNFDFAKCERYKETGRYTFPLTIDLRPFCEQRECPDSEYLYELFSVIIHKGGCYGGHYHVYIKDIDQLGHWEPPEEELKEKQKEKTQKRNVRTSEPGEPELEKDDPLSVLIAVLSQEESKSVPIDQLSQKLMDKIGTSWKKTFRKQYGPIAKFLQSHSDVFLLVAKGTRVTLKATSPPGTGSKVSEVDEVSPTTETSSPCENSPEVVNEVPPETLVEAETEVEGAAGCRWFDLNDSSVASIRQRDIEKQFEGKESAYMLFYRKANLKRPSEALGNPAYRVPPHLLQMVEEENAKLQQRREEFDASSNSIEVRLHLAPHYRAEMGALRPVGDPKDAVITITFDRRKTVGDLRLAVYQMQDLWEGDMALTVAQSLPAGLHLYDTLTDDQQSLYSAGVNSGSDLFVWNGREVSGSVVRTGAEWEPLLLTVVRPSDEEPDDPSASTSTDPSGEAPGAGLVRSMQGFARGATLGTVLEALGPQEALVCRETSRAGASGGTGGGGGGGEGGGASGWKVFPPQDMQRTLRELALKDGDALLLLEPHALDSSIFSLSGDMVTVTTPSDCRWLQVEFRGGEQKKEEEEETKRRRKVPAAGNMLLSEVKKKAIEELELEDKLKGVECCLRQMDRTGNLLPPVYDDITVKEAGIRLMTTLFLCPGPAPKSTQLFLSFTVGSAPSAGHDMDIIVEETLTVKECLTEMLKKAGLEGDAWHLNRMSWDDEVGEVIMDENATLSKTRISHGDKLMLSAGCLPPKGFLILSIWLYVDLRKSPVPMEMEVNHTTERAASHTQEVICADWHGAELRIVGKVEITDEATLEDLKTQVMTLPALLDMCVPTPAFLRMWQLEGHKLGKILRGNQQSLRKLKVTNGAEICVQRLLKEEDLGPKDLLLRVQMSVPGERQYFPWEEFAWEAGNDSSPRALRVALSTRYGLSPDSLLMAKRLPEKHSWMPVSTWTQQVSKRKKKKKNDNLQGAPYHFKDGDIVGIKNLLIDSNRDFNTLQDELDQQRLREEAERLKKGAQSDSTEANQESGPGRKGGQGKNRKPEVALSINVGVFR